MWFDEKYIRRFYGSHDYNNGLTYYRKGRVKDLRLDRTNGRVQVTCMVQGTFKYNVKIEIVDDDPPYVFREHCTCPRFEDCGSCKHLAAAMFAVAEMPSEAVSVQTLSPHKPPLESDPAAKMLMASYLEKRRRNVSSDQVTAHLAPRLTLMSHYSDYPALSLTVGVERMYVVKDIQQFLNNVAHRKTVEYGKNLTLFHGIEGFDPTSRALIELLMDEFIQFRTVGRSLSYTDALGWPYDYDKSKIKLDGPSFDRLFDILRQFPAVTKGGVNRPLHFQEGDPAVKIRLGSEEGRITLSVDMAKGARFFGSRTSLYIWIGDTILRCSGPFRNEVYPLLKAYEGKMRISPDDMPVFCSCILSELQGLAEVEDPEGLLKKYLPDECVPQFCFDLDESRSVLTLNVKFRYGNKIVGMTRETGDDTGINRDRVAEQEALDFAGRFFTIRPDKRFFLLGTDDTIYNFLTSTVDDFCERGEVFLSDRLKSKRFQPSPSAVGISVSDGILSLDIDTGEFPAEELEELYQSLMKKRRYYRLRDGRYLTLNGSSYERLAEMAHMLHIRPEKLSQGHMELPAFRGMYLDELLSGQEGLRVDRNKKFRDMVCSFKSVSESDYTAPPHLEAILRPYQKVGFQWLKTLESCGFGGILADEMGLGKTLQVIAFFSTVQREQVGMPNLVVCPASLVLNWLDECAKFAPELSVSAIIGTAANRKELLEKSETADLLVTSYELLRQDVEQYAGMKFYCCVLDEAQHAKNMTTKVSKAIKRIQCRQRFVLTGTPIENRLSELWNLFDFLMPGYLFSHNVFVEKLERPAVKSRDPEAVAQLRRLVQPFLLRRLKRDVLKDLPPKIEHIRRISLSEEERKTYLATVSSIKKDLLDTDGGGPQVLTALMRLRQICCAPGLCYENYEGPSSKLMACLELCAGMTENGHQILLFSQFTSMLELIRNQLNMMHISNFMLQGSTPKETRAQLVRRFNAGEASVFLISLRAGGTGLNLTAADVVIHYDPWWNQSVQDQATDRAHRIGQQSSVQVYKLIAQNTIEERILELQDKKAALFDTVWTGTDESIQSMSKEDLLALLD